MRPGTLLSISQWPPWKPGAGSHPAIVWQFDIESGLWVVLPISHSDKYVVKGIELSQAEFGAAYLASGPLNPDKRTSYIHITEFIYENDIDERTIVDESGQGIEFDEVAKVARFPNWRGVCRSYTNELWLNAPTFEKLKSREVKLLDPQVRLA